MSDNDIKSEDLRTNKEFHAYVLRMFLETKLADAPAAAAPLITYAVFNRDEDILYTPRFLVPPVIKKDEDFEAGLRNRRTVRYLDFVNNELVGVFKGGITLEKDEDLDAAIRKVAEMELAKKISELKTEQAATVESEEDGSAWEDDEEDDENEIDKKVFSQKWKATYEELTDKISITFDELLLIKGALIISIIGSLYLVTSLSASKELAEYDDRFEEIIKFTTKPRVFIHIVDTMIYDYVYRAVDVMKIQVEKGNIKLRDSCQDIYIDGISAYNLCSDSVRKRSCPVLDRLFHCHVEDLILNKMKEIAKKEEAE